MSCLLQRDRSEWLRIVLPVKTAGRNVPYNGEMQLARSRDQVPAPVGVQAALKYPA
jgi:hypothetical protein